MHRTRRLSPDEVELVRGIPVTTVARTLVDLAEVVDLRSLERAMHEAEVLRLLDTRAVLAALERVPGRHGARNVRTALGVSPATPDASVFAEAFLDLCARYGLPRPRTNVLVEAGGPVHEADCVFPEARVIVELDGEAVHGTRRNFHGDRRRDAALAAAGFQTLRYTWDRVTREDAAVAAEVRRVLHLRSSR